MGEWGKFRIRIEGIMPERALLRIRRAGIKLFSVRKASQTALDCTVYKKDLEKIFAIYPKVCYTISGHSAYCVRILGEVGILKYATWIKRRAVFLLGALGFCIGSLYVDTLVFDVEFVGTSVYARETLATLEECGVRMGLPYRRGKEDLISAKLLSLRGVEFCSVKKDGLYVCVEMRLSEEMPVPIRAGAYTAEHAGEILSITALRGTALKQAGESVQKGETLIADYFTATDGEKVRVDVVGRAVIACIYEAVVEAETEEEAFATAYLSADIGEKDTLIETSLSPMQNGFCVRLRYTAVESFNL